MVTNTPPSLQTGFSVPDPHQPHRPSGQQGQHLFIPNTKKFVLILLAILIASAIGSLSLAQILLPSGNTNKNPGTITNSAGGACTATPQNMQYQTPSIQDKQRTYMTPLPGDWFVAGRQEKDLAYALACAADFVLHYQTFDAAHVESLEASTFMLSAGAKERFSGHAPHVAADPHMNTIWRKEIQKQHMQQTASAQPPYLLQAHYTRSHLLVWFIVPYQIEVKVNGQSTRQDHTASVLLVASNPGAQKQSTGWQVAGWQDGTNTFPVPDPL